jgi:hypothetical protein
MAKATMANTIRSFSDIEHVEDARDGEGGEERADVGTDNGRQHLEPIVVLPPPPLAGSLLVFEVFTGLWSVWTLP